MIDRYFVFGCYDYVYCIKEKNIFSDNLNLYIIVTNMDFQTIYEDSNYFEQLITHFFLKEYSN